MKYKAEKALLSNEKLAEQWAIDNRLRHLSKIKENCKKIRKKFKFSQFFLSIFLREK